MFRNNAILMVLLALCNVLIAQPALDAKRDQIWLFGYGSNPDDLTFGGSVMDFGTDPPDIYYQSRPMNLDGTNASICDVDGNLLCYTNGIYIANANHQKMFNGGGLSPGIWTDEYAETGMIIPQGALILPYPDHPNLYVVFHGRMDVLPSVSPDMSHVYYSIVDMDKMAGLGSVVQKNVVAVEDTLDFGKITATRHGNGRDWWILVPELDSKRYYRLLLSPAGVENLGTQSIGAAVATGLGQAAFSPDGSRYVRYEAVDLVFGNYLNTYDFDRCSGELSNHRRLNVIDTAYSAGVAISPNSRYVYCSSYRYIYQYDLTAIDLAASRVTVAVYDGYTLPPPLPPVGTRFFLSQLAPDGKIYISCTNGVNVLHVINSPDEQGLACDVAQHGVTLPTLNAYSMPNFPNFRLGKLEGSPCDSIVVSTVARPDRREVEVFPNPASSQLTLSLSIPPNFPSLWSLRNAVGQEVMRATLPTGQTKHELSLPDVADGLYFWQMTIEGRSAGNGKLVIHK